MLRFRLVLPLSILLLVFAAVRLVHEHYHALESKHHQLSDPLPAAQASDPGAAAPQQAAAGTGAAPASTQQGVRPSGTEPTAGGQLPGPAPDPAGVSQDDSNYRHWVSIWFPEAGGRDKPPSEASIRARCRGTSGDWCGGYYRQQPLPAKPPPRGAKECPNGCNTTGNCNYDTGLCECPAGAQGPDCGTVLLRPCTNRFRDSGTEPLGHIDAEGRDLDLLADGYTESRCTGICDPVTSRCFCDGKYRRINPPPGSPIGTPPIKVGRPLGNHLCQLSDDGKGHKLEWGQVPYDKIYGPDGWCNSDSPVVSCPCSYDGFVGPTCDELTETMCPNQCSGHGDCIIGFCKCHEGWYGTDCARRKAGLPLEPGVHENGQRPWLADTVVQPPALADTEGGARARRRPLVYVYDLPPAYNARMLQYRVERGMCTWRSFNSGNTTEKWTWTYGIEVLMHELFLQSEHRTFDPEEADYFYVPTYGSCLIFPLHCYADGPWWHAPSGPRVMHVTNMMLEVRDWIKEHFPYWNRRGGRDHIWLMTHDEGACYAPTEIYNASILLTHWGRMDMGHKSNTAFTPDNYTQEYHHPMQPNGWLHLIDGHPCFTPGKDLVVPALKMPEHYSQSPMMLSWAAAHGAGHGERKVLLYLKGDVGKFRLPCYSRGIRQKLYNLTVTHGWKEKYNILIGDGQDVPGDYGQQLTASKFCAVAPGDGWSTRLEDAALHGCIPVLIMDQVQAVFESILDYAAFSIRITEAELTPELPEKLLAVPEERVRQMQDALRHVWHRFAYVTHPMLQKPLGGIIQGQSYDWLRRRQAQKRAAAQQRRQLQQAGAQPQRGAAAEADAASTSSVAFRDLLGVEEDSWEADLERRLTAQQRREYPASDDAFGTILQWLYHRIPHTRG